MDDVGEDCREGDSDGAEGELVERLEGPEPAAEDDGARNEGRLCRL